MKRVAFALLALAAGTYGWLAWTTEGGTEAPGTPAPPTVWSPQDTSAPGQETVVVDSEMTLEEALEGTSAPRAIAAEMELLTVRYHGFGGELRQGQIVVHRDLANEVAEIFQVVEELRFPVAQVVPIVRFGWDDSASVAANNTSGFNYRRVAGTRVLSHHAAGRAVDLNPLLNPDTTGTPILGAYDPGAPGTLTADGPVVRAFRDQGWTWGGIWRRPDYHHFEKP